MADWLTGYSDDNKIIDGVATVEQKYGTMAGSLYLNIITTTQYRYVSMTYDAAVSCRDTINDPTGTPTKTFAQVRRQNDANAYQVDVTEVSETTTDITPTPTP